MCKAAQMYFLVAPPLRAERLIWSLWCLYVCKCRYGVLDKARHNSGKNFLFQTHTLWGMPTVVSLCRHWLFIWQLAEILFIWLQDAKTIWKVNFGGKHFLMVAYMYRSPEILNEHSSVHGFKEQVNLLSNKHQEQCQPSMLIWIVNYYSV